MIAEVESFLWTLGGQSHLGESLHVVPNNLRVGTLQFADDFKALIELREHVHHRAGEQSVLWCDLELENEKKEGDQGEKYERPLHGADVNWLTLKLPGVQFPLRATPWGKFTVLLHITDNEISPSLAAKDCREDSSESLCVGEMEVIRELWWGAVLSLTGRPLA